MFHHIHGIVLVHASEVARDFVNVIDDAIGGQMMSKVLAYVSGEAAISTPQQQRREESGTSKSVHRNHDVDMREELIQQR